MLWLAACDGGDSEASRSESAEVEVAVDAWRSAMREVERTQAQYDVERTPEGRVEVEGPCPDGGSIQLEGHATDREYTFTVSFSSCVSARLVMDGQLSLFGDTEPARSEYGITGELDFSGDVELSCVIDIEGSGGASGAQVRGSVCGHDASVFVET